MAKMSPRELKKIVAEEMISKKSFDSKAYGREYYENNKEIIKARSKATRIKNAKQLKIYWSEYYKKNKDKKQEYDRCRQAKPENIAKHRVSCNKYEKRRRKTLLNLMGDKCMCCGETDPIYLQFDHVDNDGYLERSPTKGRRVGKLTLLTYLENPKKWQLLCANCNWAKHANGGKLYKPKKRKPSAKRN